MTRTAPAAVVIGEPATASWGTLVADSLINPGYVSMSALLRVGVADLGGGVQLSRYYKDGLGVVHLEGGIVLSTSLVSGTALFTLPVGCRPLARHRFTCDNGHQAVQTIDIHPDGTGQNGYDLASGDQLFLDGIRFYAEQ